MPQQRGHWSPRIQKLGDVDAETEFFGFESRDTMEMAVFFLIQIEILDIRYICLFTKNMLQLCRYGWATFVLGGSRSIL